MKFLLLLLFVSILVLFTIYKTSKVNVTPEADAMYLAQTPEEEDAINIWSKKSNDEINEAASKHDPVALYLIGMWSLQDPIDEELANLAFFESASLGFAPAIEQLFYAYREHNPWLALVYLKLAVASGHPELRPRCEKMHKEVLKIMGNAAVNEVIEKIALHKKEIIERNKTNKGAGIDVLQEVENNVAYDDVLFDEAFWFLIDTGKLIPENLEEWLNTKENRDQRFLRNKQKAHAFLKVDRTK